MKKKINIIIGVVVGLALFSACTSFDCTLNNIVYGRYTFYVYDDSAKVYKTGALPDTLTVTALGTDSVLLNRIYGATSIELPVSYFAAADTLVFLYADTLGTVRDTLWIDKANYEYFESPDCPTAMFHTITSVRSTHNCIDTITLANPSITYEQKDNFNIYLRSH